MSPNRTFHPGRAAWIAALATTVAAVGAPAAGAAGFPRVNTAIDQLHVLQGPDARPQVVTWRSTATVESDPVDLVPETTLGPVRYVDRSALGAGVAPDYPVTIRGRVRTPQCDSYDSARWIGGSDFVTGGRFWAGLEGTTYDFTGYHQSRAPNGSQQQWAELGVGGFDRYPPQPPKPGGHMEGSVIGSSTHDLRYLDPAGACWIGGVKRVEGRTSFGVASYRAVGGDVAFGGDEDLPELRVPIIDGPTSVTVAWAGGVPGISLDANAVVVTDEDNGNTELILRPYVSNPGVWRESHPSLMGIDWQFRFYVIAYWDQPYTNLNGEAVQTLRLDPGERATVMTREAGGYASRDFRADGFSELSVDGDGAASLAPASPAGSVLGENGTPFPELNSCTVETWDNKLQGLPVTAPDRSDDGGDGTPIQGSGIGDPSLPYSVPAGWLGFDLAVDQGGAYTLRNVTVAGMEGGELTLPHVRIDGVVYPLTTDKAIEGPIAYERQVAYGGPQNGYTWNTLLLATVYRVAGVEFTLYWALHARVIADSRGAAACGVAEAIVSDGLNPLNKEVQLQWFVGADIEGHGKTAVKQWVLGQGNTTVANEKTVDRSMGYTGLTDSSSPLYLTDKTDPDLLWLYQEAYPAAGSTTMAAYHGAKAAAPRSEVDGESIDGVRLAIYQTEEPQLVGDSTTKYLGAGRNGTFTAFPIFFLPCTQLLCPN